MNSKEDFLKNMTGVCVYEAQIMKMIERKVDDVILKTLDQHVTSFIADERFDLSKKKTNLFYGNDIGIFYSNDDVPNIVAFNLVYDVRNWRLYVEEGDIIQKYDFILGKGQWSMKPIEIKSNSVRIRCEDILNKKTIYNIFIDDLNRYKKIFKYRYFNNNGITLDQCLYQIRIDMKNSFIEPEVKSIEQIKE